MENYQVKDKIIELSEEDFKKISKYLYNNLMDSFKSRYDTIKNMHKDLMIDYKYVCCKDSDTDDEVYAKFLSDIERLKN